MGNTQAPQSEIAEEQVKPKPHQGDAQEDKTLLPVIIPKKGQNAYDYNDNSTDHVIGRGAFGIVFRATRNYDEQIFAIKVAKIK